MSAISFSYASAEGQLEHPSDVNSSAIKIGFEENTIFSTEKLNTGKTITNKMNLLNTFINQICKHNVITNQKNRL